MKTLHLIILSFLTTFTTAQEIKVVKTKALIPIAKNFGIDSALRLSGGFPIYVIDTSTAITLLDFMKNYYRYSRTEYFFNQMAHNWEKQFLKDKTIKLLKKEIGIINSCSFNPNGGVPDLDDKLIISALKQKPDSIENLLVACYWHYSTLADSYKKAFPSGATRFIKSFKNGTHPTVEAYEDCNLNCYKVMWALGQLNSKCFNPEKLNYHNSQLRKWRQVKDMMRFEEKYHEYEIQTVNLINQYNSIEEIVFSKEPELMNLFSGYETIDKCWKTLFVNEKMGILDLGCSFAPLAGHGVTYKLELLENNKVRISKISEWIS